MRGRGGEEVAMPGGSGPRPVRGTVYWIDSPIARAGVWNGQAFIAISLQSGSLVETQGEPLAQIGVITDPNIRLQPFLRVSCSYCGGNLELDESGAWVSSGACRCSPPSPFKAENHALRGELEDLVP